MNKQNIKDLFKLGNGDILIIFDDGAGMACENPIKMDKASVKKMLSDEMSMVAEEHQTYVKLEEILKNFGDTADGKAGEQPPEPGEPDNDVESEDESGDGDS
jgi:hypothetical protein